MNGFARTRMSVAVVAVVAFVAAAGGVAFGNHVFPDVSTGSAFHDEVANVVGAGIATGFPDGTYRPKDSVNRQQMAAFMNRGGGRAAYNDTGGFVNATVTNGQVDVTQVTVSAGATGTEAEAGFVFVTTSVTAETPNPALCPCSIGTVINAAPPTTDGTAIFGLLSSEVLAGGLGRGALSATRVVEIGPDETMTFTARAFFSDANQTLVKFSGQISAIYVPFGPDGGNDL